MFIEPTRHALNGTTMGTRWSALFYADAIDCDAITRELQNAVDTVDRQMSTYRADSDLMQFNAADLGKWITLPTEITAVISLGLAIGIASNGAFDIGMGGATLAWGFGPTPASPAAIETAMKTPRPPAYKLLELDADNKRIRKHGDVTIDLNGIAKGFGVDQMTAVLRRYDIKNALLGIDGELYAMGRPPIGAGWAVAIENPIYDLRSTHSVIEISDAGIATSGDYRHWVDVQGKRLSHTMNPNRGLPITGGPASVTVVAPSCAMADGWATALMVLGNAAGGRLARELNISALFLNRKDRENEFAALGVGPIFVPKPT